MVYHAFRLMMLCGMILSFLAACSSSSNENKAYDDMKNRLKEDSLQLAKERLDIEAKKLEIARQRIEQLEEKHVEQANTAMQVELAKKANVFQMNPNGVVITERAFFHEKADLNTRKNSYLMRGDQFTVSYVSRDFVFVS
ncbi:MAG: hypothetical protein ACKO5C_01555, partial [Ferruginibacter sp.]